MRGRLSGGAPAYSPERVFLLILAVVFSVEMGIMLAARFLPKGDWWYLFLALADPAILVLVLCPSLWFLVIRPMQWLLMERGELLRRVMTIQEQERERIARDLHDELGQTQTALLLGLHAVGRARPGEVGELVESAREMATEALESTRRVAHGLSPVVLHDFGLEAAVQRICEGLSHSGRFELVPELSLGGRRFDPAVEIAIYRVAQEALANAARHSGASRVTVVLRVSHRRLMLIVADNGRGIEVKERPGGDELPGQGLGLVGMRERMVLLGGTFTIESGRTMGTTLRAEIAVSE